MPTLDLQVSATADDAVQSVDILWFSNAIDEHQLSQEEHDRRTYQRFAGCTIPHAAPIIVAYLTFTAQENFAAGNIFNIKGFLENDVGNFPDRVTSDGYNLTVANQNWTPGAWTTDTEYDSPSLVDIVQEQVNQVGWAGIHIGFRTDTTTRDSNRIARSWDFVGNLKGVKLHIEYSVGIPRPGGMAVGTVQIY